MFEGDDQRTITYLRRVVGAVLQRPLEVGVEALVKHDPSLDSLDSVCRKDFAMYGSYFEIAFSRPDPDTFEMRVDRCFFRDFSTATTRGRSRPPCAGGTRTGCRRSTRPPVAYGPSAPRCCPSATMRAGCASCAPTTPLPITTTHSTGNSRMTTSGPELIRQRRDWSPTSSLVGHRRRHDCLDRLAVRSLPTRSAGNAPPLACDSGSCAAHPDLDTSSGMDSLPVVVLPAPSTATRYLIRRAQQRSPDS
jgi:hypothetical protein